MNIIDIILIILAIFCVITGISSLVANIVEQDIGIGIGCLALSILLGGLFLLPFVVIDKASGSTFGIITSIDKNFWGTTALYIKTTETNEEEYCIEYDEKLEEKARKLIGKKVKITYGKRIGLYSTGKCSQSPIETIEEYKIGE